MHVTDPVRASVFDSLARTGWVPPHLPLRPPAESISLASRDAFESHALRQSSKGS